MFRSKTIFTSKDQYVFTIGAVLQQINHRVVEPVVGDVRTISLLAGLHLFNGFILIYYGSNCMALQLTSFFICTFKY